MALITDLPTEILDQVLSYLRHPHSIRTFYNLCLVSRRLNKHAHAFLHETLPIVIHRGRLVKRYSNAFSRNEFENVRFVRRIVVEEKSLMQTKCDKCKRSRKNVPYHIMNYQDRKCQSFWDVTIYCLEIRAKLRTFQIRSLRLVDKDWRRWSPWSHCDETWFLAIFNPVSAPLLREVVLRNGSFLHPTESESRDKLIKNDPSRGHGLHTCRPMPYFCPDWLLGATCLTSITFCLRVYSPAPNYISVIRLCLQNARTLRHLDLEFDMVSWVNIYADINQLVLEEQWFTESNGSTNKTQKIKLTSLSLRFTHATVFYGTDLNVGFVIGLLYRIMDWSRLSHLVLRDAPFTWKRMIDLAAERDSQDPDFSPQAHDQFQSSCSLLLDECFGDFKLPRPRSIVLSLNDEFESARYGYIGSIAESIQNIDASVIGGLASLCLDIIAQDIYLSCVSKSPASSSARSSPYYIGPAILSHQSTLSTLWLGVTVYTMDHRPGRWSSYVMDAHHDGLIEMIKGLTNLREVAVTLDPATIPDFPLNPRIEVLRFLEWNPQPHQGNDWFAEEIFEMDLDKTVLQMLDRYSRSHSPLVNHSASSVNYPREKAIAIGPLWERNYHSESKYAQEYSEFGGQWIFQPADTSESLIKSSARGLKLKFPDSQILFMERGDNPAFPMDATEHSRLVE